MVTRGNVAIYCYNALTAKTWDVAESTGNELTSMASKEDTILAKFFSDFTNENGKMKLVEDATVTVSGATTSAIGANQVKIDATDIAEFINAEDKPRRNYESATYCNAITDDYVIAYVPAEVANIANLAGKTVDVIFGKDNQVAYLVVTDDALEAAYVTAWDYNSTEKHKSEIEINETAYDLADTVTVKVFNYDIVRGVKGTKNVDAAATAIDTLIVTKLGVTNPSKYMTRNIIAETTINADDEIETINFKFSTDYTETTADSKTLTVDQYVVEKISSKNVVTVEGGSMTETDLEDLEEEHEPRVIRNGEIATLEDIAVGDVITEVVHDGKVMTLVAVANTFDGEVADYVEKTNAFEIDGTDYISIAAPLYNEEGEVDDYTVSDADTLYEVFEDETVTVYLNMAGEVVAMVGESEATGTILGVVTEDADLDEDSDDVEYLKVRILSADGKDKIYKIYNKKAGKDIQDATEYDDIKDLKALVGTSAVTSTLTDAVADAKTELAAAEKAVADALKANPSADVTSLKADVTSKEAALAAAEKAVEVAEAVDASTATVVRFAADENRVIKSDDIEIVSAGKYDFKAGADVDVINVEVSKLKADIDNKKLIVTGGDTYRYSSSTVILDPATKETISWEVLTDDTQSSKLTTISGSKVWLAVDGSKIVYAVISVAESNYGASDLQYGILENIRREKDDEDETIYIATVVVDGSEEEYECDSDFRKTFEEGSFIAFKVSDGEIVTDKSSELVSIDLPDYLDDLDDTDTIDNLDDYIDESVITYITTATTLEGIKVKSVETVDGFTYLVFEAAAAKDVDLGDNYMIYNLVDGEEVEEINEGDLVIVLETDDTEDGYDIVIVL